MTDADLGYGDPRGVEALRAALADYLGRVRGVVAEPSRVMVTCGYSQGLDLVCRTLARGGAKRMAFEDPSYPEQKELARRAGLEPVAVAVDEQGIVVDELARTGADAVVLTPAHQHPTGVVLAGERRTELLTWLRSGDAIAIDDDYDAEYRYDRAAVGAVQGLDPERVVYAGSASKTLAPALRIGWLVLPSSLVEPMADAKRHVDHQTDRIEQHACADFLVRGELDRHLRRMRVSYRARRDALIAALGEELPETAVSGIAAGLHATVRLPDSDDEAAIVEEARRRRIVRRPDGRELGRPARPPADAAARLRADPGGRHLAGRTGAGRGDPRHAGPGKVRRPCGPSGCTTPARARGAAVRAARPGQVGIYACGPTVYSRVHVGNARPFVVFSQLKRFLEHEGYDVTLVANITDINDKIYDAARAAGRDSADLAREMTAHYIADTERLGLGRPDHEPLASEYVEPIVDLIGALVERGHAYAAGGDVYFRVRTLPEYGALSRRDVDQMDQGEGVEGADRKEDPLDFALWKAHKEGEDTSWDSPWGRGRPGWHIECSAMAEALLGLEFDIHGGGIDLVFPHHENEVAQTVAGARQAAGAAVDAQRHARGVRGREDGQVGRQHPRAGRGARRRRRRGAGPVLLQRPLPAAAGVLAGGAGGGGNAARRIREAGRRLAAGRLAGGAGRAPRRVLRRAGRRLQHRRGRWPRCTSGSARRTSCREGTGDSHLREMLGVLGLESLLEAEEGAPAEAVALADAADEARARQGLGRGRPAARRAARPGLGGARRPAGTGARPGVLTPPRAGARRVLAARRATGRLRPQPGARGAARPPPGPRIWATGAPRGLDGRAGRRARRRDRGALRLRRPPGRLRRGRPVPVRRRGRAAGGARAA